jgi:tetratricopeptide (TPR) repeat protein
VSSPDAPRPEAASAAAPSTGPTPARRGLALELLAVSLATAAAYATSLGGSFHYDDLHAIVRNPAVRDPSLLWPPLGARWLGTASFALGWALFGEGVLGHHLLNLAIHVASALCVHRLARASLDALSARGLEAAPLVRRWLPLVASLLFALHPVETEAVTYLVQRVASLATLLALAALLLYLRARRALDAGAPLLGRAGLSYALSIFAAAAAVATKENAVVVPVLAALLDLAVRGARPLRKVFLALPLALGALPAAVHHAEILSDVDRWVERTAETPRSAYLLTEARVAVTYLRLLAWPAGQSFDWDYPLSRSLADPRVLGALALLLALAALAVVGLVLSLRARRAEGVLVFVGAAWFLVALLPESSLVPLRDVLEEHRLYLPSVGAALAAATILLAAVARLPGPASPRARVALLLAVTAAPLGAATAARNLVYRDEVTLWRDAASKGPAKARPHQQLGAALLARGEAREAVGELEAAVRIDPWYPEALANLGVARADLGETDLAIEALELALRMAPELAMAHNDLGTLYEAKGWIPDAVREYREALRLSPGLEEAQENLARLGARR